MGDTMTDDRSVCVGRCFTDGQVMTLELTKCLSHFAQHEPPRDAFPELAHCRLDEDGLMWVHFMPGVTVDIAAAQAVTRTCRALNRNTRPSTVVDFRHAHSLGLRAWRYFLRD